MAENTSNQTEKPGMFSRIISAPGRLWGWWSDKVSDKTNAIIDSTSEAIDALEKNKYVRAVERPFEKQYELVEVKTPKDNHLGYKLVNPKGEEAKDKYGSTLTLFFKTKEDIYNQLTQIEHDNKITISRDSIPLYYRYKKAAKDSASGHKVEAATDGLGLAVDSIKHPLDTAGVAVDAAKDGYAIVKDKIKTDAIGRATTADNVEIEEVSGSNGTTRLNIFHIDSNHKRGERVVLDAEDAAKYTSKDELYKNFGAFEEKYHVNISRREIPFTYTVGELFNKIGSGKYEAAVADVISGYNAIKESIGEVINTKWGRMLSGVGLMIAGSSAWSLPALACSMLPGAGSLLVGPALGTFGTTASLLIGGYVAVSAFTNDIKNKPDFLNGIFGKDNSPSPELSPGRAPQLQKSKEQEVIPPPPPSPTQLQQAGPPPPLSTTQNIQTQNQVAAIETNSSPSSKISPAAAIALVSSLNKSNTRSSASTSNIAEELGTSATSLSTKVAAAKQLQNSGAELG